MVILEWTTASESNNYGFEVERSFELKATSKEQNTGNHDWIRIGFVPGHGSATGINNYNFTDKDVIPGTYYYSLKQMDLDGNFEYYPEIAVKVENPQCASIEQNYPNPFNSETVIRYQIPKSCHVIIKVYNTHGQEIKKLIDEEINVGYYQISWDGKDNRGRKVPTGVYLYRIKTETYIDVKKMIMIQ